MPMTLASLETNNMLHVWQIVTLIKKGYNVWNDTEEKDDHMSIQDDEEDDEYDQEEEMQIESELSQP